jgi:hypothetical protein
MLTDRIIGAFTFRKGVYAEVEHETSFTSTAWLIVIVVGFLNELGSRAAIAGDNPLSWLLASVIGTVFAVIGFALAAVVISAIGKALFNAEVNFDELVRTLGLAYVWRAIGVLGVLGALSATLSCVIAPATLVAAILGLVAWFVATKEALDLEWVQVIVTVVVGWIAVLLVQVFATFVLGLLGLGAAALGGLLG